MASHIHMYLHRPVPVEELESAIEEIRVRRFKSRWLCVSTFGQQQLVVRGRQVGHWNFYAPGTREGYTERGDPDEDLGFEFWFWDFEIGRNEIEFRSPYNHWVSWNQKVFMTELARALFIRELDYESVGVQPIDPIIHDTFFAYATRNFPHPITRENADYVEKTFMFFVPAGWE